MLSFVTVHCATSSSKKRSEIMEVEYFFQVALGALTHVFERIGYYALAWALMKTAPNLGHLVHADLRLPTHMFTDIYTWKR